MARDKYEPGDYPDIYGWPHRRPDTSAMLAPYECTRCRNVHDAGKVTPVGRHADCTTWHCPGCGSLIDDRPISWGGSARRVDRGPRRRDGR